MLVWGITPFAAVAVSVPNYRSLGGIKCGDRVVRHNTILRSATPSNATAADVAYLRGTLQLASVVDLRAPEEALKDPGARRLPEKVDHVYHSIFDEPMLREGLQRKLLRSPLLLAVTGLLGLLRKLPARTGRLRARLEATRERKLASLLDRLALSDVYWWMLEGRGDELRAVLEQCATATPLLLHCTHGKDRTGLVSALVLYVCGASRDAIVADYTASNEWGCSVEGRYIMEQMMPARLAGLFELDPWCEAPPEAIEEVFAKVQAKYGSVDAYLDGIGFGAAQRQRLRDRLTEEATT